MHITRAAIPGVAAITVAAVAGCGGGSPTTTTNGSSGSNGPGNGAQAAYRFSACMRQHGVTGFPDPVVHHNGNSVAVGIKVDPTITGSPAFQGAQRACGGLLPNGGTPAQQAARIRYRIHYFDAFAACMRSHGITAFPDPTSQGEIGLSRLAAAGINIHEPNVIAAARACVPTSGGLLTQAAISQATGSG